MSDFRWEKLERASVNLWPFPWLLVDNAILFAGATAWAVERFVEQRRESGDLYLYDNALERKLAFDRIEVMPDMAAGLLREMNGPQFLCWLERQFGLSGLIPDPYLRGGGIHAIPPGGHLDVHVDFNVHPKLGLHRRLNALVYLNRGWPLDPEEGGALELWSAQSAYGIDAGHAWNPVRIAPMLGRLVVFETSERSFHGHPIPTPEGLWRYALSSYYYTAAEPPGGAAAPHSTRFVALPGEMPDPERQALRERRDRGRLSSNTEGRA